MMLTQLNVIVIVVILTINDASGNYIIRTRTPGQQVKVDEDSPLVIYLYQKPPFVILGKNNTLTGLLPNLIQIFQNHKILDSDVILVPVKEFGSSTNKTGIVADLLEHFGHLSIAPSQPAISGERGIQSLTLYKDDLFYFMVSKYDAGLRSENLTKANERLLIVNGSMEHLEYCPDNHCPDAMFVKSVCEGMRLMGVLDDENRATDPSVGSFRQSGIYLNYNVYRILVSRATYLYYYNEYVTFRYAPRRSQSSAIEIFYPTEFQRIGNLFRQSLQKIPDQEFVLAYSAINNGGDDVCHLESSSAAMKINHFIVLASFVVSMFRFIP